jgi:predicted ribosome quality control (RQC) complex YloA/Tae2 family protein
MALSVEEITLLLDETRDLLAGRRVRKIYHIEPHELYVSFRTGSERVFLFMTTRPQVSRFHARWEGGPFPPRPSAFCEKLRAELSGRVLATAVRLARNRAVRFDFDQCAYALVGEFFGARGNVILLHEDRVAGSLWPIRRGGATLRPGHAYRLPPEPPGAGSRQHPRYLLHGPEGEDAAGDFSFSRALAAVMDRRERELNFTAKRARLRSRLTRERKRQERLLARLDADRREAENAEAYRRQGEALKCHLREVKAGQESLTVPDPFDPERRLEIRLDPACSPPENLERLFRRYRKLKAASGVIEERHAACVQAIAGIEASLAVLNDLSWEREEDVRRLDELTERHAPPAEKRARGARQPPARRERRFVLHGHQVWVGRSAKENAELVRRIARGNDLFLHIAGRPGAVVIVRPPAGKEATPEVLAEAGVLAVYYSMGREAGSQDVDYTRVKHVRMLGDAPGRFTLAGRRTLRVSVEADRLSAILSRRVDR